MIHKESPRQFQKIVMTFFMEHALAYLDGVFVSKQRISLEKYMQVMGHKFLAELDRFLQCT